MGPGQHHMLTEADTANGGSTSFRNSSEEQTGTGVQSTNNSYGPLDRGEPDKPQMNIPGTVEKDFCKQDTCTHQQVCAK